MFRKKIIIAEKVWGSVRRLDIWGHMVHRDFLTTLLSEISLGYCNFLLAFAPMYEEEKLTSEEHFEFLQFVLSVYASSTENVVASDEDNENTNLAFACRVEPTFAGNHNDRFNLAAR